MLKNLRLRIRSLFLPHRVDAELDEELRFHLEQQTRMYMHQGLSREAATRRARLDFGSVDDSMERHRDGRGSRGIENTLRDVRYGLRSLMRDRALVGAGILTLGLGIGAVTAVFSAVNAVLLRELPFADPDRLVQVWEENPDRNWYENVAAPANYLDWREQATAFEDMAGYTDYPSNVTLVGVGEPTVLAATYVTGNFLDVLGVRPLLGDGFTNAHTFDNGDRPVLLSHRLWRERFGSDPGIMGKSISLGGARPWQVVGVLPPSFAFPSPGIDVFLPTLLDPASPTRVSFRRAHWLRVVGRLKPGVSLEAANASLQTVVRRLQEQYPLTNTRMGAGITPLHEWIVGQTQRPLVVLLSATAVLLLIACANVGNLLLVHALGRTRDVSLRFALGASRGRVVRQAMSESLLLSAVGGAAGVAIGWAGARALLAIQPAGMLPVRDISIDWRVLIFALVLTAISGLVFGAAPALIGTRQSPAEVLNSGGRTLAGGYVRRWGRYLVMAEVALAVILMVGAGLLARSYERLSSVPPGFDATGVMTFTVSIPASRYDSAARVVGFYSTLADRLRAVRGVDVVGLVRQLPATVPSWSSDFSVFGRAPGEHGTEVLHREVLGDYFRAMRVPLIEGRLFDERDDHTSEPVAIINDIVAKRHFPNGDAIGKRITFNRLPDSTSQWRTIVGIVGSEHQGSLAEPRRMEIFVPVPQDWRRSYTYVVRAQDGVDPVSLAAPIRQVVASLDSLVAIQELRPMTHVVAEAMARERFVSTLVAVFAVSGVVLALVGVFGILAQAVQARWREMGIRMALGAQQGDVRRLVLGNGLAVLGIGTVAGLLISVGATRILGSILYDTSPMDPLTYLVVAALVIACGLLAAWTPAWRASRANPATTLRAD